MTKQDIEDVADLINILNHTRHTYRSGGAAGLVLARMIGIAADTLRRLEDSADAVKATRVGVAAEARRVAKARADAEWADKVEAVHQRDLARAAREAVAKRDEFRSPEVIAEEAAKAKRIAARVADDRENTETFAAIVEARIADRKTAEARHEADRVADMVKANEGRSSVASAKLADLIDAEPLKSVFVGPTMALDYAALEARVFAALGKPAAADVDTKLAAAFTEMNKNGPFKQFTKAGRDESERAKITRAAKAAADHDARVIDKFIKLAKAFTTGYKTADQYRGAN